MNIIAQCIGIANNDITNEMFRIAQCVEVANNDVMQTHWPKLQELSYCTVYGAANNHIANEIFRIALMDSV